MTLEPITLRESLAFVERVHRHHAPPRGGLFALAACVDEIVVAVAIVGRPVARTKGDLMSDRIHYIVGGETREGHHARRFVTEHEAELEARRLAASTGDDRAFIVYEARSTHRVPIVSERCVPPEPQNIVAMTRDEELAR